MENVSILGSVRSSMGLQPDAIAFDNELMIHINSALVVLWQNGCGKLVDITDDSTTWGEFKDATQPTGNQAFSLVPAYVFARTKLYFDPPPPSNVSFYEKQLEELLYRIRLAYEEAATL